LSGEANRLKQAAADAALELITDGMAVGLGSGSTAELLLAPLAARVRAGLRVVGVPTSERTATLARDLGIPLASLVEQPHLDITIDGADEILLPSLTLVKGRGGALLREKLVAASTDREVIIADEGKLVAALGTHLPLPVEVIPFGWQYVAGLLRALGCEPVLRPAAPGQLATAQPYITDGGNYVLDCRFSAIPDPLKLAQQIKLMTGVVEHGLFVGVAALAIVAGPTGVRRFERD